MNFNEFHYTLHKLFLVHMVPFLKLRCLCRCQLIFIFCWKFVASNLAWALGRIGWEVENNPCTTDLRCTKHLHFDLPKTTHESNITEYTIVIHHLTLIFTYLHSPFLIFTHFSSMFIFMALSFDHVPPSSIQLLGTKSSMDRFTRSRSSSSLNCAASSKASRNVLWLV